MLLEKDTSNNLEYHVLDEEFLKLYNGVDDDNINSSPDDDAQFLIDEIRNLIAIQFTKYEPLTKILQLDIDLYRKHFCLPVVTKAVQDELCIIAIDVTGTDNKDKSKRPTIAGVFLNEDFYDAVVSPSSSTFVAHLSKEYPSILPIFEVMEILDRKIIEKLQQHYSQSSEEDIISTTILKPGTVLHAFILAVNSSPHYAGKGIAKKLSRWTCQFAKRRHNYSWVAVEATSPITTHIWTKMKVGEGTREGGAEIVYSLTGTAFISSSNSSNKKPFEALTHPMDALLLKL